MVICFARTAGNVLGTGFHAFIDDPNKIVATAGGLTLLALGVYTARTSTGLLGKFLEARLGKPSLVRDTSRLTLLDTVKHPINVNARQSVKNHFIFECNFSTFF